jgi:hypothetical protein
MEPTTPRLRVNAGLLLGLLLLLPTPARAGADSVPVDLAA